MDMKSRLQLWLEALRQPRIWQRAAAFGLSVGFIQSVINQGDVWWNHRADKLTLAKTILSPMFSFSAVLLSGAGAWVENRLKEKSASTHEH
jgi:hypothetical protein